MTGFEQAEGVGGLLGWQPTASPLFFDKFLIVDQLLVHFQKGKWDLQVVKIDDCACFDFGASTLTKTIRDHL